MYILSLLLLFKIRSIFGIEREVLSCMNAILDVYRNDQFIIYVINSEAKLGLPVVQINTKTLSGSFMKVDEYYSKVDVYIFPEVGDDVILAETIQNLSTTREFNARALYVLVASPTLISSIFPILSKYYIYRVVVLNYTNENNTDYALYSYKPFAYESVRYANNEKRVFGNCSNGNVVVNDAFDVPKKWRNTTVDVLTSTWPPYLYFTESGNVTGVEVKIFGIIKEKLGFDTNFIKTNDLYWGTPKNGKYDMAFGKLQAKRGDMVMGSFHTKHNEHLDFDLTFAYTQDAVYWVVPAAKVIPPWKRISFIFSVRVWCCILLCLAVTTAVMYLLYRENFFSPLYQILLEHSVLYMYTSNSFRIFLTVWTMGCLIFMTGFKSNMTGIFIGNIFGHQISTVQEIVESDLIIILDHDMADLFKDSSDPYERYVSENYIYCEVPLECTYMCARGEAATSEVSQLYYYLFPHHYVKPDGTPLLHILNLFFFGMNIHWFFVPGYPLLEAINTNLERINSAGITAHAWRENKYEMEKSLSKFQKFQSKSIGLDEISIAFFLWLLGIIVSSVTFCIELTKNRFIIN